MLGKIFAALRGFFSSLFGSGSSGSSSGNSGGSTTNTTSTSRPSRPLPSPPEPNVAQDASELQPDTVVIVAHEMEEVVILPNEVDQEFDEDIFMDNPAGNEPIPVEEPEPEPEVSVPEPEPEPEPVPTGRQPRFLWCLDNGHGSLTAGKRSPVFDDGETQFLEYDFNRDIVARMIPLLDAEGIRYFNVVPEVEVGNILQERVARANNKSSDIPKIFLSIHSNAGPARSSRDWTADSIKGVETWYYHGSKKGQKVASIFQRHILEATGFANRHLKSRPDRQFYVLRKTRMTAVLTENGFYNNKQEARELMKDSVRQKIAEAHVAAILEIEENGI